MSTKLNKIKTTKPMNSILPDKWKEEFVSFENVTFDNLDHFVYVVSELKQNEDDKCGMLYKDALDNLIKRKSDFPESEQEFVRNLVRKNLLKRGLITQEVYESFRYTSDGTNVGVDVGKYAAGEAECVLTPARHYIDFFYELYISISYPYSVTNSKVRENVAKLLATIEELERQHIFIKINVVLPIDRPKRSSTEQGNKFFSLIPLFSHKDAKSVSIMSSVVNDKLLRKFYFAILENLYGDNLAYGYGTPMFLKDSINIGGELNEIELFESIKKKLGA